MKIRIGHLSTFYHTAILLMASGDADTRLEAKIEWTLFSTGPAIVQAFKNGKLDLAYIGLPPAIIGIDQGIGIVCVAGGHMEGTVLTGKSLWHGFPEKSDLREVLNQFRGDKIGVPGKGSIHDVILKECLERYALEREIEIINYASADLVLEAVAKDEISAAMGTPALAIAIGRFAGGRVLYPPAKLWPCNPSYGIIVDKDFLTTEKKIVERFLQMHEEATSFIRNRPQDAARRIADYVGIIDAKFVSDTLVISPKYCADLNDDYVASTMKFVPVLKKLGYIRSEVAQERIFSRELIERIHPEKDHYSSGFTADK